MSLLRISRSTLRALCSRSSPRPLLAAPSHVQHQLRHLRQNNRRPPQSHHPYDSPLQKRRDDDIVYHPPGSKPEPEPEYQQQQWSDPEYSHLPYVRIRYLRPAIWCFTVSAGIYTGLAYLEAKDEIRKANEARTWLKAPQWATLNRGPPGPVEILTNKWETANPIAKLSYGIIGTNCAVHLFGLVLPQPWNMLWHLPVRNVSYTNFTSMFVHSGPMHLLFNMWATYNFIQPVGYSRQFEGSPYHVLSFFLSAGVLSGFAQHWSTIIATNLRSRPDIWIRGGGASGALFAILGAFCVEYPTAQLGIMFLPINFEAQYFFPAVMLFDFVGMVRGYSFVNFGHAAHLSGALIGAGYCYFDGKNKLWKPLVRFWKKRLQSS